MSRIIIAIVCKTFYRHLQNDYLRNLTVHTQYSKKGENWTMASSTCLMFLLAPAFPDRKSVLSNFNLFDQSTVL